MTASLREATAAEVQERDVLTHESWGLSLTVPQYQERERRLRGHAFSREGMTSWVWADGAEVLASCETFRMESRLQDEAGVSYGVASVYTAPALRGRGHATQMMRALVERLRGEHAVILFSDVGEAIYARAGFTARPSFDRVFRAEHANAPEGVSGLVTEATLAATWESVRWPAARFALRPTAAQLDWHLERERVYSELLGRPRPSACGAWVGRSSAFWAGNVRTGELMVLWLEAQDATSAVALMQCASRVAHQAGMSRVVLWECPVPFSWPRDELGGSLRLREGSLTIVCPLTPELEPGELQHAPRALWI